MICHPYISNPQKIASIMRRLIKILASFFILLLLALVSVPFLVPMSTLKAKAIAKIEESTGRKVQMGEISLSLLPNIALKAQDVLVGNPAWVKGSDPMAKVKTLRVGVELMPLFHGDIHVTDVALESPSIHLIKNGDQANWQFGGAKVTTAGKKEAASDEGRKHAAPPLRLDSFSISQGDMMFEDEAGGSKQHFAEVNLKLNSKNLPASVNLSGDAVYNNSKTSLTLAMGAPLGIAAGEASDVDLKVSYGELNAAWKGTLALRPIPTLTGTITLPQLDLRKQEGAENASGETKATAKPAGGERWSSAPISMQPLGAANADVTIEIGKMMLSKMTLDNVGAHVKLSNGMLNANLDDLKLFSGIVKLAVSANQSGATTIKAAMNNVQVEELLQTLAQSHVMVGVLNGNVDLSMHGNSQRAMVGSLAGNGHFNITDGSYRGGNFVDMTRNVATSFQRGTNEPGKTDFKELSGSFTAKDGVFANNDLKMTGTLVNLTGTGQIDLPQWMVHYLITPELMTNRGSATAAASGVSVPVQVEGSLDAPSYHPDLRGAVENIAKDPEKIKDTLKNAKDNLKDIKKGLNKDTLRNLLGR